MGSFLQTALNVQETSLERQGLGMLGGEERGEAPGPGPWTFAAHFAAPQACYLAIGVQTTSRVTRQGNQESAPGVAWLVGWCPFIGGQQENDQNKRKGQPRGWLGWW